MTTKIPVTFTLGRPAGGAADGSIRLSIRCANSAVTFLELTIDSQAWVDAQFGQAGVPALGEIRKLDVVGKRRITETRSAVCPERLYDKNALQSWLVDHCQESGWILDTYLGSQSSIVYQQDGTVLLNYRVCKWVDELGESS